MAGPWEKYQQPDGPWAKFSAAETPSAPAPQQRELPWQARALGNLGAGVIRGAGSIGATLMAPFDYAQQGLERAMGAPARSQSINQQRRADITAGLRNLNFDPESMAFGAGKLGAEVAGTLGVGGGAANAITNVAPRAAAAAPNLVQAVRTAGMSGGNMATRAAGGAVTGGLSAGLVNPEDAGLGAAIGGVAPGALKVAGKAGQIVGAAGKHALGLSTGVGAEPVSQAFKAGQAGNREFLENMRGNAEITAVLDRARQGLSAMRAQRSQAYRSGMIPIKGDKSVLDLAPIDAAIDDAFKMVTFKGQTKNEAAAGAVQKMRDEVAVWRQLDPAEFHTPEGLDALKQRLGAIIESIPFESRSARLAAGQVYNATKQTIEQQAPTYAKVMRDYSQAQDSIREIERALSLGDRAAKDTAMRKLQSLMRNNVQTNYGNRLDLAHTLEDAGHVSLMPSLAGQAMSSATPRSLSGQAGGVATALMSIQNPAMLAALPFQSPRIVGEAMYGLGRMTGGAQNALRGAPQALPANALQRLAQPSLSQFGYRAAPVFLAADQ